MSVTYIHYGSDKFDKSLFKPIRNREYFAKPYGGLWASREGDIEGWKTWCEDEGYHEELLEHSFTFTLKPSANIHVIEETEDIYKLPRWKESDWLSPIFYPDFEECIRKGIDAIEIIDIYGVDASGENSVYMTLYGWDCNSILILNPDIVEEVL